MEVVGIATKESKGAPMRVLSEVLVTPERGLEGDRLGKAALPHRKATLQSLPQWEDANRELRETKAGFVDLPWYTRRANICLTGVSFGPHHIGQTLYLVVGGGETIPLFEVTEELEPCKRMDKIEPGLQKVLTPDWRGGVACRVLNTCTIREGDTLYFI